MIYTKRFIDLSMWGQVKLIMPSWILSVVMAVLVYCVTFLNVYFVTQLVVGVVVGVLFYFAVAVLFKMEAVFFLKKLVKM